MKKMKEMLKLGPIGWFLWIVIPLTFIVVPLYGALWLWDLATAATGPLLKISFFFGVVYCGTAASLSSWIWLELFQEFYQKGER